MKKVIFLVILAITIVILYQCFYNQEKEIPEIVQTATEVQIIDTLNLGILKYDTINPLKSKNEHVQQISRLIFEPLFNISKEFKIESCLAKECTKIDDTTYIIKLRENVLLHDTTIFNTNHVEYVINQIKADDNSIFYNNVENIKNVKIIDENTLRLDLYEPESFFEYNLIFPIIKDDTIGTGKYKVNNDVLTYNDLYWGKINPAITTINIRKYDEMGQMYNDFKNGEIDIINTKEFEYKNILGEIGFNKKEYYGREHTYLELNNIELDVRQAIYYAINKSEIIAKVYDNNYYDAEFPLDISNWLYKDTITHKYDIENAIKILEDNKWQYRNNYWQKNGKKLQIKLLVESMDEVKNEIAYILKNQLEKIGIKVELEKVSKNLYEYYLENKNYDIIINTKYIGVKPDLQEYFNKSLIIDKIKNTNNERELLDLYRKLEEEYIDSLPFISLCYNKQTLIYSQKIHGSILPNWYNIFYDIENWKKINENT